MFLGYHVYRKKQLLLSTLAIACKSVPKVACECCGNHRFQCLSCFLSLTSFGEMKWALMLMLGLLVKST